MARKLVLVPVAVVALFVTPLGASASRSDDEKVKDVPAGWSPADDHRPAGGGDGRRMR